MSHHIERVDARDLDLDTADRIAAVVSAAIVADGLPFQAKAGADVLTSRQLGFDCRPVDAVFLASEDDRVVGEATVELPALDNTDSASVRLVVHPEARRRGVGAALWAEALRFVDGTGRTRVQNGAWLGTSGVDVLDHYGLRRTGVGVIRRLDLHATPSATWDALHAEAASYAGDYE